MNKQTLILFDVGGVLAKLNFNAFYKKGAEISYTTIEDFRQKFVSSKLMEKAAKGKISKKDYLNGLREILKRRDFTEEQLKEVAGLYCGKKISKTVKLKEEIIIKGYAASIFSNTNQVDLEILKSKYPEIYSTSAGIEKILSFQIGDLKRHSAMYERVKELGNFSKIIYIDDNYHYLENGVKYGWQGIWLTPFIDSSEVIRDTKNTDFSYGQIKVVNSIKGLISELKNFEVVI